MHFYSVFKSICKVVEVRVIQINSWTCLYMYLAVTILILLLKMQYKMICLPTNSLLRSNHTLKYALS